MQPELGTTPRQPRHSSRFRHAQASRKEKRIWNEAVARIKRYKEYESLQIELWRSRSFLTLSTSAGENGLSSAELSSLLEEVNQVALPNPAVTAEVSLSLLNVAAAF